MTANASLAYRLLGLPDDAPLVPQRMADGLRITFFPPHERRPALDAFTERLRGALQRVGATIVPFEEALTEKDKVREGLVIIEQGEPHDGQMAMRRASTLYHNPLVAVYDREPPVDPGAGLQETLDGIVDVLAWNLTHTPIFVHDGRWTVCTMNGAVIPLGSNGSLDHDVLHTLVPKLAAQVKPPDPSLLTVREGAFDPSSLGGPMADFIEGARAWAQTGLLLAHTSLSSLRYRNRFAELIASTFLDNRTGMSYGFLARQLPVRVEAARPLTGASEEVRAMDWGATPVRDLDGAWTACARVGETDWLVEVPDVSVLCTRSGCDKTNIDPETDLVRLSLSRGRILFDTPNGIDPMHTRPSYDTLAILSHAAGNAIAAAVLRAHEEAHPFAQTLERDGLALAHWHDYPPNGATPPGFVGHGQSNPPVSCSTPQSAAFALVGKLEALGGALARGGPYRGDIHVEPHHGTNLSGAMTLAEAARWAESQKAVGA